MGLPPLPQLYLEFPLLGPAGALFLVQHFPHQRLFGRFAYAKHIV